MGGKRCAARINENRIDQETRQYCDFTVAALADSTRRVILARLTAREASVAELAQPFAMTPPAFSNGQAEEAMNYYTSIFKNSKILSVTRFGKGASAPEGTVITASFELNGRRFRALNGGPKYTFSPATSFVVHCETQDEVDYYWDKLVAGGKPNQCAWLDDKFGISWQIVPKQLMQLLNDPDPVKAGRVMQAMFKMSKIVIADLQHAYDVED